MGKLSMAQELKRRGWFVLPSYDYSGKDDDKAPRLQGLEVSYVIPDLDVCRHGRRAWVEVKTKGAATLTRTTGRREHGISQRHWRDYWHVQRATGCEVFLCIYEENTNLARMSSITRLQAQTGRMAPRLYNGTKMGRHGMIFFPQQAFTFAMAAPKYVRGEP